MEDEVLSQEPFEEDDDDLFADADDSMPEESEEAEAEETQPTPFLTVKYNKEDRNLTEDEARDFAEKGMNYDKIRDRYNELNGNIEYLARKNGMDTQAFINSLFETQKQFEIQNELESLKNDYPDTDENVLEELARTRVEGRDSQNALKKEEQMDALDLEAKRQLDRFLEEYPDKREDVLDNRLDPQVFEYVKQGMTLLEAYSKWERADFANQKAALESQQKAAKQNEENRKRSLGNTTNAGGGESDAFLDGFLND